MDTYHTFPRVYARNDTGVTLEVMRGEDINDSDMLRIRTGFGPAWSVWREDYVRSPIGAHVGKLKRRLVKTPALNREELRAMEQGEYPFKQGGRFVERKPEPVGTEVAT